MSLHHPEFETRRLRVWGAPPELTVQVCKECGAMLPPDDHRFYSDPSAGARSKHEKFHQWVARGDHET